jgi:hypothetical protein
MGVNAQIEVPAFTAGQVLTAAEMTQINTGIPVFATTTTRDAAFGGAGEKVLAEGQFAYIEATNTTQYYDGAAWQPVGVSPGLVRVGGGSLSSTSTTFTSVFSSTYNNYKIVLSNMTGSGTGYIAFRFGTTSANYYYGAPIFSYAGATSQVSGSNVSFFRFMNIASTSGGGANIEVQNPNLAVKSNAQIAAAWTGTAEYAQFTAGFLNDTTQYTSFTILAETGTLTGTCDVYGYTLS